MELMVSSTRIDIIDLWIGKSCATWNILPRMVKNYLTFNTKVFPLMGVIFICTGSPTFFYRYTGCQPYRHCILTEAEIKIILRKGFILCKERVADMI